MKILMRRSRFLLLALACLLIAPVCLIPAWGPSYPERKTAYSFREESKEIHAFDAVGEGRDYDSLRIYDVGDDAEGFLRFVSAGDGWHALPLPDGVRSHPLCDAQYDPNMAAMLNEHDGFWYMGDAPDSRLYVYSAPTGRLYMRQASVVTGHRYAP